MLHKHCKACPAVLLCIARGDGWKEQWFQFRCAQCKNTFVFRRSSFHWEANFEFIEYQVTDDTQLPKCPITAYTGSYPYHCKACDGR